ASLIVLPRLPFNNNGAEVQMLFRRIRPPAQYNEKERHQRCKRGHPYQNLPYASRRGQLRRGRTRHPAKTRRTGQPAVLIRYAFAAKGSAAMWAPCRRFSQRMKQAASMAQARRGGFVEGCGWFLRNHSSGLQPRSIRSQTLRNAIELGILMVRSQERSDG